MFTPKIQAAALILLTLSFMPLESSRADQQAAPLQSLLSQNSPSIVTVRMVIKTAITIAGQAQSTETRSEVQGAVVDSDGLVEISDAPFSANKLLGSMSMLAGAMGGLNIKMTPGDFHVIIGNDPTEYPAFLAATDEKLGLMFIQIDDLKGTTLTPISFSSTATPTIAEPIVAISRLSRDFDYSPYFQVGQITGEVDKPQTAYLLDQQMSEIGLPVFAMDGTILGIITTLQTGSDNTADAAGPATPGLGSLMSLFSGGAAPLSHLFLVPAQEVAPAVAAAKTRATALAAERSKAPPPASTKPAAPAQ